MEEASPQQPLVSGLVAPNRALLCYLLHRVGFPDPPEELLRLADRYFAADLANFFCQLHGVTYEELNEGLPLYHPTVARRQMLTETAAFDSPELAPKLEAVYAALLLNCPWAIEYYRMKLALTRRVLTDQRQIKGVLANWAMPREKVEALRRNWAMLPSPCLSAWVGFLQTLRQWQTWGDEVALQGRTQTFQNDFVKNWTASLGRDRWPRVIPTRTLLKSDLHEPRFYQWLTSIGRNLQLDRFALIFEEWNYQPPALTWDRHGGL